MDERLTGVAAAFRGQDRLFHGVLDGMTEEAWLLRPGGANHLAFLATHLVAARHFIVRYAGGSSTDPLEPYHQRARSIDEMSRFPGPGEARAAWDEAGPILHEAIGTIPADVLEEESGVPFPASGPTRLDALVFLAQHEAYHLGQMGLLRRIAGLPAADWR